MIGGRGWQGDGQVRIELQLCSWAAEAEDAVLRNSLAYLLTWLRRCHGERVVVLIDEYDTPIHEARRHGYYEEAVTFFRTWLGEGLKLENAPDREHEHGRHHRHPRARHRPPGQDHPRQDPGVRARTPALDVSTKDLAEDGREQSLQAAQTAFAAMGQLPIALVGIDRSPTLDAAHVKAHHSVFYADAFAVTLAMKHNAPIATGIPEFGKAESLVPIHWMPLRHSKSGTSGHRPK